MATDAARGVGRPAVAPIATGLREPHQ